MGICLSAYRATPPVNPVACDLPAKREQQAVTISPADLELAMDAASANIRSAAAQDEPMGAVNSA